MFNTQLALSKFVGFYRSQAFYGCLMDFAGHFKYVYTLSETGRHHSNISETPPK